MLRHAYHWRLAQDPELPVYRYVQNWGRPGDAGVIAFEGRNVYGAAWYRLFSADEPGFGFVDEETPELTVAVVPSRRGHGAGAELLDALLGSAREDGFARISLSAAATARPASTSATASGGARGRRRRDDGRGAAADRQLAHRRRDRQEMRHGR